MDLDIDRLNRRLEARIELQRWQTIFNGGSTGPGNTISSGVPTKNNAQPIGAAWTVDGVQPEPVWTLANPIVTDLRYWLMGGLAAFRKYVVHGYRAP